MLALSSSIMISVKVLVVSIRSDFVLHATLGIGHDEIASFKTHHRHVGGDEYRKYASRKQIVSTRKQIVVDDHFNAVLHSTAGK